MSDDNGPQVESIQSGIRGTPQLGAALRKRRRALGYTQRECAQIAAVSTAWLSGFENGKSGCEIGMIMRLANILGVSFSVQVAPRTVFDELTTVPNPLP